MTCDQATNEQNAQRAQQERPGVKFAPIAVTIKQIDAGKIVFTTRGEDDAAHDFSVGPLDVWLECPSTAQQVGDRGVLYLSEAGGKATSLADGKTRIKGTTAPAGGLPTVSFKWPEAAGTEAVAPLPIWPTRIIIEGYAHGDPSLAGAVTLLDLRQCDTSQLIRLDAGGMITLSLTKEGFAEFSVPMPDAASPAPAQGGAGAPAPAG